MTVTYDTVLAGGLVVDGTGRGAFAADVGMSGGRIETIGDLSTAEARERVDVTNSYLAPGFIDVHTHSDLAPFLDDEHLDLRLASLRQGVTTEICGNCGFSVFPTSPDQDDDVLRYLQTVLGPNARSFASLSDYRGRLASGGLVTNLGTLVGHGTLRAGIIGFANRAADRSEMGRLMRSLHEAIEQGGLGFSSGLIYTPGAYAPIEELVELAKVAAEHALPYVTHMRDEMDDVDAAIDEALRIGAESGAAVQISHHKTAGKRNWGHTEVTLARIERARTEGIDVAIDVYPYTAGSTVLAALLPPWVGEGGIPHVLERLASTRELNRIRGDFEHGLPGWQKLVDPGGWRDVVVAGSPRHPEFEGRSIAGLAEEHGVDDIGLVAQLLVAEQAQVTVVLHMMAEEDVARVIASPLSMIGSDGIPLPGKQHPRWAGSFARIIGKYVSADKLLTLEEAVHKMTQKPAERFRLKGKGVIAAGMSADLVVFDLGDFADRATYAEPLIRPTGVVHVLVNGEFGIRSGEATAERAGRFVTV
jgi:N-acyl-D-amino-acid deacylase